MLGFVSGVREIVNELVDVISETAKYHVRDSYTPSERPEDELNDVVDFLLVQAAPTALVTPQVLENREVLRGFFSCFHSHKPGDTGALFHDYHMWGAFDRFSRRPFSVNYATADASCIVDGSELPMELPERHFLVVMKTGVCADVVMCVEDGTIWSWPDLMYYAKSLPSLLETVLRKLRNKEWLATPDCVGPPDFFD